MAITLRSVKGTALTYPEMDENFTELYEPLFRLNKKTIEEDVTLTDDYNRMSVGPIEIADGVTVTMEDGAVWTIV